ncbi:MAG: hypothetical protein RI920_1681 [Pseudomonadota bacterium]|jgi:uncharacterized membrane protein YfcA
MPIDPAWFGPLQASGLGAVVGLVLALTGAGGGVLAVPLLVLVLHWPLAQAAPTALLAVGLAAALGAAQGLRQGEVRWRAALLMGGMGMLGAPVGVALSHVLPARPLLLAFALLMLWLAWRQWPRATPPASSDVVSNVAPDAPPCVFDPRQGRLNWTSPCARAISGTGLLSGVLSGLIGVGGGFVIVPALRRHTDLALRQVQLTSLAVITLVALSGVGAAAWHGQMPWSQALPFAAGAIGAMLLGRRQADRMPEAISQRLFAIACVGVAGALLVRTT